MLKKPFEIILVIGFLIGLNSCAEENECPEQGIESFDHFLGLDRETREFNLVPILGRSNFGYFSEDSSAFIYQYLKTENVPLSIWVNADHGRIETIFMEILGIETFEEDLDLAIDFYEMDKCESQFFGMSDIEIIQFLGKPTDVQKDVDEVNHLFYSNEDFSIQIEFKFYPDQNFKCSSISLNWN